MNKQCVNCKGEIKIYLKSDSLTDVNKIDFSSTEQNSKLDKNSVIGISALLVHAANID